MIEWEKCESEASGKLMCALTYDGSRVRKNNFILSFTKTAGSSFTEVLGGADKTIPVPTSDDDFKIENFCLLPYFEDGSFNIKNCSLELEFLQFLQ